MTTISILRNTLFSVIVLSLLAACESTSHSNRRIYDRYAELVAERNRVAQTAPQPGGQSAVSASAPAAAQPAPPVAVRPAPAAASAPGVKPATPVTAAPAAAPSSKPVAVVSPAPPPPVAPPPAPAAEPRRADPPPSASPSAPVAAPVAPAAAAASPSGEDVMGYTLKQGDVVQVYLRGIPSAEAIEAIIDEYGMISLPFINEIVAEGQTASELSKTIRRIYQEQGIYRNISVNVVVPTRFYFIQGEIRAPGRFQMVTATRVSQAIAGAGGYTEFASGRVQVKRGGKIHMTIRNARRLERTPQDDILLEPDDIIEVLRSRW